MTSTSKLARCALVVAALMCAQIVVSLAAASAAHATDATDDLDAKKKKKKPKPKPQPPGTSGYGPCMSPGCGPYGPPWNCVGGYIDDGSIPPLFYIVCPEDDEE